MTKGTPSPQYALRPAFVLSLKQQARRLHNASKALSRRQWATAKMMLDEWNGYQNEYEGEITKDEYYAETSRCICDELGNYIHVSPEKKIRRKVIKCHSEFVINAAGRVIPIVIIVMGALKG